jgi:hypothetical protein
LIAHHAAEESRDIWGEREIPGGAENAIKAWSQLLADGMYAYTSGARKP